MKYTLAIGAAALVLLGSRAASAQDCLHGQMESPANQARRQQAVRLARQINSAEASFGIMPRQIPSDQRYKPLDQLRVPAAPVGFQVMLHTDGRTYSFSLKDSQDPCGYALFSDQSGVIYEATPLRETGGIVPLNK